MFTIISQYDESMNFKVFIATPVRGVPPLPLLLPQSRQSPYRLPRDSLPPRPVLRFPSAGGFLARIRRENGH